jgi:hypothetical protein
MPTRQLRNCSSSPVSPNAAVHCTKSRIIVPVACGIGGRTYSNEGR